MERNVASGQLILSLALKPNQHCFFCIVLFFLRTGKRTTLIRSGLERQLPLISAVWWILLQQICYWKNLYIISWALVIVCKAKIDSRRKYTKEHCAIKESFLFNLSWWSFLTSGCFRCVANRVYKNLHKHFGSSVSLLQPTWLGEWGMQTELFSPWKSVVAKILSQYMHMVQQVSTSASWFNLSPVKSCH